LKKYGDSKMSKPSVLTIRVPNNLKQQIEAGNKILSYWHEIDKNKIFDDFDSVMQKVKKRKVPKWDSV